MENLLAKMRKARESKLPVKGWTLLVRRPTDLEATMLVFESFHEGILGLSRFVIGWEGVKMSDVLPDGDDSPAPFSQEVFEEWIQDQPEIWEPMVTGLKSIHRKHHEGQEEDLKN